jgi:hypothetical protein
VTCGAGGVGKTTTAAALATMAAIHLGGRVLVLTVDPARRLADALGLAGIGNDERRVAPAAFRDAGLKPRGELWAAMLDTKASWDDLIRRHAPDERTRDAILVNPLYENITARFVQSHDYIAMERLYEIHSAGTYDLIVVGSGIAGLHTAWRASQHGDVLLLTKRSLFDSATAYAQGGIAAALGAGDSPTLHRRDTLAAGAATLDDVAQTLVRHNCGSLVVRDDTGRMLGIRGSRPGGHTALDVRQSCDHDHHGYPPQPSTRGPASGRCTNRTIGGITVGQSHHEKDQDKGRQQHKHLGHPSLRTPLPPVEHLGDADQKRPALCRYPLQELLECPLALLGNTAHRLFNGGLTLRGHLLHRGLDDRGSLAHALGHGLVDRRTRLRRELGR